MLQLEIKNVAKRELSEKLRLENSIIRQLRPLFNRMNKDFSIVYRSGRGVIDFNDYMSDVKSLLRKHYQNTQRRFKGSVQKFNGVLEKKDDVTDLALISWIDQSLQTQPQEIIDTTQKDANEAVSMARANLMEQGEVLTPENIAIASAVINRRKLFARINTIAITETQRPAEATKYIEAQRLSGRLPYTLENDPFALTQPQEEPIPQSTKQWVTVRDKNVRASHMDADRQVVNMNEPFVVGGAELRIPGDSSLGAPVKEWINCRCSAVYNIDGF